MVFAILQGVMVNSGTCGYTLICRMTRLPLSVCGSSSEQGSGHVDGTVRPSWWSHHPQTLEQWGNEGKKGRSIMENRCAVWMTELL